MDAAGGAAALPPIARRAREPGTSRRLKPARRGRSFAFHALDLAKRNGILQFFVVKQVGGNHGLAFEI